MTSETEQARLKRQYGLEIPTVGDTIENRETGGENHGADPAGLTPRPPKDGEPGNPIQPPRLEGQPEFPKPGIYLGMDESLYHSIHACSGTGIKKLAVSSMDYWSCSPLNPDNEDEDTPAKALGRAYHVRICEGREAYESRYCVDIDKADHPHALVTEKDIVAAFPEGVKPVGKDKRAKFEHLRTLDGTVELWDDLKAEHRAANEGKHMLRAVDHRRIEIAAKMIEADPALRKAFTGGHPEVSIFFYDEDTGVPCKARLDYLKMAAVVDLKSYSNTMERPISRAIDFTIAGQKHYVAVVFYQRAIVAAKKLIRAHGASAVNGADDDSWWLAWAKQPEPTALWVYQQSGRAPVTRGRIMHKGTVYSVTEAVVEFLLRKWRRCAAEYGSLPWLDIEPVQTVIDEHIPLSATDFGDTA